MKKLIPVIAVLFLVLAGCNSKQGEFKVDKNDPSSVVNASKADPVPMRSDGTPVAGAQEQLPPAKQ